MTRRFASLFLGIFISLGIVFSIALSLPFLGNSSNSELPTFTIHRGNLLVTLTEDSTLESAEAIHIRSEVGGKNTITWLIESGTYVQPGDLLVKLDTLLLEDQIHERSKYAHLSQSTAERLRAEADTAELQLQEYLEGSFPSELRNLEKELAVAESNFATAQNLLAHARAMTQRGYVSELEVADKEFAVTRAKLDVEVKLTEIDVLKRFTKEAELVRLRGELKAIRENYRAENERAKTNAAIRDRALQELEHCTIYADRSGMVIRPKKQEWEESPIEEGTSVWKTQTVLLMPDLMKIEARLGIHESIVERIKPGQEAIVTLPDKTLRGYLSSVDPIARPAGWWTGNAVTYDAFVRLEDAAGIRPGTSAEVELVIARHEDVLLIPVDAILDGVRGLACWVATPEGPQRRSLVLGDTNDFFVVVKEGVVEGEKVVLDPELAIEEARLEAVEAFAGNQQTRPQHAP